MWASGVACRRTWACGFGCMRTHGFMFGHRCGYGCGCGCSCGCGCEHGHGLLRRRRAIEDVCAAITQL
jgi:hypothetical protein